MFCSTFEKALGTPKFIIFMFAYMVFPSLLCSSVEAFFHYVPGINDWKDYGYLLWYGYSNFGS